ncbi:MAG: CHAT domain-containing protein [Verrucomicrobiota bacterium JB023]|nr:CHAT domain-containing protein [Verrucomicrobiota bacterium JB023]
MVSLVLRMGAETPAALYQAGRFSEALTVLSERAQVWADLEAPTDDDRRELADTHLAMGMCLLELARPADAVRELEKAIAVQDEFQADLLERAAPLDTLGRAWQAQGHYEKAGQYLLQALRLREQAGGAVAEFWQQVSRDHLGLLRLVEGRYEEAGKLLEESLAETGTDRPRLLALRHHNVARYLLTIRNLHRAEGHAVQSVELARQHAVDDLASYLDLLTLIRLRKGDSVAAEITLFEALEEFRKRPDSAAKARGEAELLNKLGQLLLEDDPAQAADFFQQALTALEPWLYEEHPALAPYYNNLGLALMKQGSHDSAAQSLEMALALLPATEKGHQRRAEWLQNRAWNALLAGSERTPTLVREACLAAEDVLAELLSSGTERERLNFLARFDFYSLPAQAGETSLLAGLLRRNKARLLETILAEKTDESPVWAANQAEQSTSLGCPAIDYVRYTEQEVGREPVTRYGAVVHLPGEDPQFVTLGNEQRLLRWLSVVNERLDYRSAKLGGGEAHPPVLRLEAALRKLHEDFLAPVLAKLPDEMETLAISPDASLHFLPFAALIDDESRFFASRAKQVLFVSSLRDFAADPAEGFSNKPWDLFGMSEYPGWERAHPGDYFNELSPLPHVGDELAVLKTLAPKGSRIDLNPDHPEERLKSLDFSPAVLHVASHAFFQEQGEDDGAVLDLDADPGLLRRSGIALTPDEANDGILFPHEIARLPLEDTTLVTLSACQTGLGTPLGGEGVLGLRRAFALAGADNLLLTLWRVPDRSTASFMSLFYRAALRTENLPASVWELQGELLGRDCPDVSDDEKLEEAVLRHAPFVVCHRGPIPSLFSPDPPQSSPRKSYWKWVLSLLLLALCAGGTLLIRRVSLKKASI